MKKFKFSLNGNDYELEVVSFESVGSNEIAKVSVNGAEYEIEIKHEKSKTPIIKQKPLVHSLVERRQITDTKGQDGLSVVRAPIPGVIIDIKLKVGDKVKLGDTVMVLEAMKMQNEIQAPRDGVIKEIKVSTDNNVYEGDVLFSLE